MEESKGSNYMKEAYGVGLKPDWFELAHTQEAFDKQCDEVLAEGGFPVDNGHRELYCSYIQHADSDTNLVSKSLLFARIRKQIANFFAYQLIQKVRNEVAPNPTVQEAQPEVAEETKAEGV